MITFEPLNIKEFTESENRLVEVRIARILDSWENTPRMESQQAKGKGVDCVRFVAGVLDELAGTKTPLEKLPRDAALHCREKSILAMRLFLKQFNAEVLETRAVQPGDMIVTGPEMGGPGHAIIVGTDRFLWHTANTVIKCGCGILENTLYKFKGVVRIIPRHTWGQGIV